MANGKEALRKAILAALLAAVVLPATAKSKVDLTQAQSAVAESGTRFFDNNTAKGDVRDPVAGFTPNLAGRGQGAAEALLTAPPIKTVQDVPAPRPTQSTLNCQQALKGHERIARLCATHPTMAPLLAGLLEALKQQFGSVEAILSNVLWILVCILISALSGFGAVAKVVTSVIGWALNAWMIWPIVKQGYHAVTGLMHSAAGSMDHFTHMFNLGVAGGTLLILAALTIAGYEIGKSSVGKAVLGSLDGAVGGLASKLGVKTGAPNMAADLAGNFSCVNDPVARPPVYQGGNRIKETR
ncbi:MAG: hypothetical protein NTX64_02010 [Elusimicrobia bacterium]|nr:hypothetical protein [Elusimicrobiota bacterium]